MLNRIDKRLTGDLLKILCDMGHGDEIVVVDANFPAETCGKRVIRMPGLSGTDVLAAVLSVFPLDTYTQPAVIMDLTEDDKEKLPIPAIWGEFEKVAGVPLEKISRMSFYDRAKNAYAVIQTGEERIYGNILLVKGVVL